MPRIFSSATAEQVIGAVEAVVACGQANVQVVAEFLDLPRESAASALRLAQDIGFLSLNDDNYAAQSPLCRFVSTPVQQNRAATLRIILESYAPFVVFRTRLLATDDAVSAARQTKTILELSAHYEEIKNTLISLGTYSHTLIIESGGRYKLEAEPSANPLATVAQFCSDLTFAEARIVAQIGEFAPTLCRTDVISPLSEALLCAHNADPRGAVVRAGNAVESFLNLLGAQLAVDLNGVAGINGKLDRFSRGNSLPKKLIHVGKYLGHVRNAADHGIDDDVNSAWTVRTDTGTQYVFVACSFIAAVKARQNGRTEI